MTSAHATVRLVVLLAVGCAVLLGCAGEGIEADTSTTTTLSTGGAALLAQIQSDIFTPSCATSLACHSSLGVDPDLSSASASHSALVGIASSACADKVFVVAADPDSSYLVEKLDGSSSICGSQMPLGLTSLSSSEIALIENWIAAGAPAAASLLASSGSTTTSSVTVTSSTTTSVTIPSTGHGG